MYHELLYQHWTILSQQFAELEIAVNSQKRLKQRKAFMGLVSKIRASLDAGLIRSQPHLITETAAELEISQPSPATARDREQMYQQILDSIADMVLVKGPKSKIVWANKAFRNYYGMTNEQLQDIVDAPFNEPDYTLQYIKDDAYVFETGQILDIPGEPVTRHDGEVRLFSTVKSPIRNEEGEVIMTVGVSRDITENKQSEAALVESEARFRRFVENANDIIHSIAPDGTFTYISPNVVEILGYHPEEMIGQSFIPFIHRDDALACIDFVQGILETAQKQSGFEFRAKHKDGSCCWMTANSSAIEDDDGNIVGIQGIVRDISDRKQVEAALIESERQYRILVETSQDLIWATDKEGMFTFVNAAVTQLYGYSPAEMIGRGFADFVVPEQLQKDLEIAERIFAGESFLQYETIHTAKNGNLIHLSFSAMVQRDEAGNIIGASGTARDITNRKTAEIERDRFFNISVDMMCICGFDGYFKQANPAFETALGYSTAEILAVPFINFVHPDDLETTLKEFDKVSEGAITINFENRYRCKDGSYKWLSWKAAPYVQDGLIYAIARDVSEVKAAEAALAESEAKFRYLVENANDLIYQHTIDGIFTYLSPKIKDITGFEAEEFIGESFLPVVHPEDLPLAQAFLDRIVATGDKQAGLEIRAKRKDGSWSWMTCNISPLKDAQGNIIAFQGVARDISDRKIAEAKLASTQKFLESVLNTLPVGVIAKDAKELRFVLWNPAAEDVLGFTAKEVLGKNDYDFFPKEQADFFTSIDRQVLNSGKVTDIPEEVIQRGKGGERILHTKKTAILDVEGNPLYLLAITEDITERKLAEEALKNSKQQLKQKAQDLEQTLRELQHTQSQLIHSEKMSSLGQLVAGVAHEINNPTSFIYGNLTHAKDYIDDLLSLIQLYQKYYPNPVPQIQEQAEEIDLDFLMEDLPKLFSSMKVGAERIQRIVLSLRTFSRMDEAEVKAVDIHDGLDSTLTILQHRLKAQSNRPAIEVIKEYGKLPEVECYASQLNQVFMNILANAIDALEESHRSWVIGHGQENINYQLPTIRINTEIKDDWVVIRIVDNGSGMKETVRKKLFDPFFTTKPIGKGTGMGLSISYQIITERHKGSLECISSPGKGAEFAIKIPLKACY